MAIIELKDIKKDYRNDTIEPIVLPQNAENFLNTEAEYLRYCHEWEDGAALDL